MNIGQAPNVGVGKRLCQEGRGLSQVPAQCVCSAAMHAAMKRDGWKNCWHCGKELITAKKQPNAPGEGRGPDPVVGNSVGAQ